VLGKGVPVAAALGVRIYFGSLFLLLTLTASANKSSTAYPTLEYSTAAGIGLFIASWPAEMRSWWSRSRRLSWGLGNFQIIEVQIAVFGLILTAVLLVRRVGGGILLGIIAATITGMVSV